jgi:hypothetical protein
MSNVIWKYELDVRQNQLVYMPIDARILSLGVQNDYPVIWAVTSGKGCQTGPRIFSVVTTGEEFEWPSATPLPSQHLLEGEYIGTVTLGKHMSRESAWYVAHVFEGHMSVLDNKIADRREISQELRS